MPPIELPITQASCSMPNAHVTACAALAMSSIDSSGNSSRYESPVAGLIDAGPVEPLQLPSELTQTTYQRSLSMGLAGPIIASHQPGSGLSAFAAAWAFGESPVRIRIALSRAALSLPQVS